MLKGGTGKASSISIADQAYHWRKESQGVKLIKEGGPRDLRKSWWECTEIEDVSEKLSSLVCMLQ